MLIGQLYVLFREISIQVLCPILIGLFIFLLTSCKNFLYFLGKISLLDNDLQIFFPLCGKNFHRSFFNLMKFSLSLVVHTFGVILKNLLPNLRSRRFTPIFSSVSCIVLAL